VIEERKPNQDIGRHVPQASFIKAVLGLLNVQILRDLLLGQVMIFPQISQSGIIIVHDCTNLHNELCVDMVSFLLYTYLNL